MPPSTAPFPGALLLLLGTAGLSCERSVGASDDPFGSRLDGLDPLVAAPLQEALGRARSSPDDAAAWGELGTLCAANGLAERAVAAFDRAPRERARPTLAGCTCARCNWLAAGGGAGRGRSRGGRGAGTGPRSDPLATGQPLPRAGTPRGSPGLLLASGGGGSRGSGRLGRARSRPAAARPPRREHPRPAPRGRAATGRPLRDRPPGGGLPPGGPPARRGRALAHRPGRAPRRFATPGRRRWSNDASPPRPGRRCAPRSSSTPGARRSRWRSSRGSAPRAPATSRS